MSKEHTIVFAGAGASFAVNKAKLPTTQQFFDKLPVDITESKLFSYVRKFLQAKLGSDVIDIEQVLWAMKAVRDAVAPFHVEPEETFWDALIRRGWASSLVANLDAQAAASRFRELDGVVSGLEKAINAQVFSHYSYRPTKAELAPNWGRLLNALQTGAESFDIFTTNYDAVIESAAAYFDIHLSRGLKNDVWAYLDVAQWSVESDSQASLLTKLHGSVDWVWGRDENDLRVVRPNHPEFHQDHQRRAIIFPGFKGVPEQEPFVSFHRYFAHSLSRATCIVFIGFAFRDEYLNKIIRENLAQGTRVVVVDPNPPKNLPLGPDRLGYDVISLTGKGFGDAEVMSAIEAQLKCG